MKNLSKVKNILIICIAIAVVGCIKEVGFDPKGQIKKTPVFHCFINPDSAIQASFFTTDGVLNPDEAVVNQPVKLSYGLNSYLFNYLAFGKYLLAANPLNNLSNYNLEFEWNGKSYLTGGTVPSKVIIQKVDTQTGPRASYGKTFVMQFDLKDSAQYKNFYRLYAVKYYWEYRFSGVVKVDSAYKTQLLSIYGNEFAFINNNFNNYTTKEILFDDKTINGIFSTYEIYTNISVYSDKDNRVEKIILYLENIEESLYNFYNSRNAHLWQQNSITQTPGQVLGNIPGAFGVVGSYTTAKYEIKMQ